MKIYTKKGDKGFTSLFGGSKVAKTEPRLEAYGDCDELNSLLGWALVEISKSSELSLLQSPLQSIQSNLFTMGSRLATDNADMRKKIGPLQTSEIEKLEKCIDDMSNELPELKNFILPGGSETSARLHVARTVSRRLERAILRFYQDNDESDPTIMAYANRISDFLFVAARYANHKLGQNDVPWVSSE
jgi:cob(I)alamin adenosyltransferase